MRTAVIGGRNRVLATDQLTLFSGAELLENFAAHEAALARADLVVWAWYALDEQGRPAIEASLRGTEAILDGLRRLGLPTVMLSTDAVFSGDGGPYGETDVPEPRTDYGRIKLAQETLMADCIRLRFTTFGPSYNPERPLLMEMVAGRHVRVDRPSQRFSPISTATLNRVIRELFESGAKPDLFHLATEPVDKTAFLALLSSAMNIPLPPDRTVDPAPLDLSLSSATHRFSLDTEIAAGIAEWRRLYSGATQP